MGRHAGHAAPGPGAGRGLALPALAYLVTVIAWGVLGWFAIQMGPGAKLGELVAWIGLGTATVGAIGCLFLAMLLGTRVYDAVREASTPPSTGGGKRARR